MVLGSFEVVVAQGVGRHAGEQVVEYVVVVVVDGRLLLNDATRLQKIVVDER